MSPRRTLGRRGALKLEGQSRMLASAAGIGLAVVLVACFVAMPVLKRLARQWQTLRTLEAQLAEARRMDTALPGLQARVQDLQSRYHDVKERIGDGQSTARILEILSEQARAAGVELTAVQPRVGEDEQRVLAVGANLSLREQPLRLQITGRYRQLGEFLGRLPEASFLGSVRNLHIVKPSPGSSRLEAELVLAVYVSERPAS